MVNLLIIWVGKHIFTERSVNEWQWSQLSQSFSIICNTFQTYLKTLTLSVRTTNQKFHSVTATGQKNQILS
jgi:hypothetical protein